MSDKKPWVKLSLVQMDFIAGLGLAADFGCFAHQSKILEQAEGHHALLASGAPYIAISNDQIEEMMYGSVPLLQRASTENSYKYCLTVAGTTVARMTRGENVGVNNTRGGRIETDIDGGMVITAYKFYLEGQNAFVDVVEETKVPLTAKHVQALLEALVGPGYRIRELQATRSLHKLDPVKYANPIEILLDEYNAWIAKQQ